MDNEGPHMTTPPRLPTTADHPEVTPQGVGFLLGVAHRARRRAWEVSLVDLNLTAPQAALLRLITAQPGLGIRQLARTLGTDPMNALRVATSLVDLGLCESRRDLEDARRRPFFPTDKGSHLASEIARRAACVERELIDALGPESYARLLSNLQALVDLDRAKPTKRTGSEIP